MYKSVPHLIPHCIFFHVCYSYNWQHVIAVFKTGINYL